jgi:hypothetical protein
MIEGEFLSIKPEVVTLINERQSVIELIMIMHINRMVGEPDSPATWSHLDLSEPVTKDLNNSMKVRDHERLKSQASGF